MFLRPFSLYFSACFGSLFVIYYLYYILLYCILLLYYILLYYVLYVHYIIIYYIIYYIIIYYIIYYLYIAIFIIYLQLYEGSIINTYYGSVRPFRSKHIVIKTIHRVVDKLSRAVARAVSCRTLTVGARAQYLASLFGDNVEIICTGSTVNVSASGFP